VRGGGGWVDAMRDASRARGRGDAAAGMDAAPAGDTRAPAADTIAAAGGGPRRLPGVAGGGRGGSAGRRARRGAASARGASAAALRRGRPAGAPTPPCAPGRPIHGRRRAGRAPGAPLGAGRRDAPARTCILATAWKGPGAGWCGAAACLLSVLPAGRVLACQERGWGQGAVWVLAGASRGRGRGVSGGDGSVDCGSRGARAGWDYAALAGSGRVGCLEGAFQGQPASPGLDTAFRGYQLAQKTHTNPHRPSVAPRSCFSCSPAAFRGVRGVRGA
jgi:hypothetical protein